MKSVPAAMVIALLLLVPLEATTLLPLSAVDLIDQSELIFTGTAVTRQVATSRDGRYPFTFITFKIDEVLKGRSDGGDLTLRFEGGELGEEFVQVEGMPEFERGGRYLLFVAGNGHNISPVVGWTQGKLEFVEHPTRPGEQVLIDHLNTAIEGLAGQQFIHSQIERHGTSVRRQVLGGSGVEVLEEVGVSISDPLTVDWHKADRELVPATAVIQMLRRTIAARAGEPSFRRGVEVPSLGIDDVPTHFSYRPTAAPVQ